MRVPNFISKATLIQYSVGFSCHMSVMMTGAGFVWFTPLLPKLTHPGGFIEMTTDQASWLIASIQIGGVLCPVPAGILINRFGRKKILLTIVPLMIISWIFIFTTQSLGGLFAARIFSGMPLCVVYTVAPIYLAEIAEPKKRGAICGLFQTMWTLGMVYAYSTGPFLNYYTYAWSCTILTFIFFITFLFAPESPYYLSMKNKQKEAERILKFLLQKKDVNNELTSINRTILESRDRASVKELFTNKKERMSLIVVSTVSFAKYMGGLSAILNYLTPILTELSDHSFNPNYISIIILVCMAITTVFSAFISDSIGRRPLAIISSFIASILSLVVAIYYLLKHLGIPHITKQFWIVPTCLLLFCIVTNMGVGLILQTLQGECFSTRFRGAASIIINVQSSIYSFVSLKMFPVIESNVGVHFNYFFFALVNLIGMLVLYAYLKETARKSLDEIQLDEIENSTSKISSTI